MSGTVVAALQFKPKRGAVVENRARLVPMIRAASQAGASLIVLPEMCTSGYVFADKESVLGLCESRDGETFQVFQSLATELDITLAFGWPEVEGDSGSLYNAATVCFPQSGPLFYRKRYLYEADTTWAEPGNTPYPRWKTREGLEATLGICMDLNDERFVKYLCEAKIRLCAFPTNWLDQDFVVWNYWAWCLQGTETCLVAANTFGLEDDIRFRGESAVLDGCVILGCASREGEDIVVAEVPQRPTPFTPDDP